MGKDWDKGNNFIPAMSEIFHECLRVLKPGAHGLVWALPRTSHWTATALELAGFEIRDVVTHLFGSGFPKSLNIGKAIREWNGWGTALKPASEHWILIRKPISEKTVAANVLKWGVGGINIDACRIATQDNLNGGAYSNQGERNATSYLLPGSGKEYNQPIGRFPANLLLDEEAAEMLDEQTNDMRAGKPTSSGDLGMAEGSLGTSIFGNKAIRSSKYDDSAVGASRFFYVAKASKRERNEGLEGMPEKLTGTQNEINLPITGVHGQTGKPNKPMLPQANFHPTVKPLKLMEYLITLITPPKGTVLDPFMGSGSTGVAATRLGFEFIGIEREKDYFEIADARIS